MRRSVYLISFIILFITIAHTSDVIHSVETLLPGTTLNISLTNPSYGILSMGFNTHVMTHVMKGDTGVAVSCDQACWAPPGVYNISVVGHNTRTVRGTIAFRTAVSIYDEKQSEYYELQPYERRYFIFDWTDPVESDNFFLLRGVSSCNIDVYINEEFSVPTDRNYMEWDQFAEFIRDPNVYVVSSLNSEKLFPQKYLINVYNEVNTVCQVSLTPYSTDIHTLTEGYPLSFTYNQTTFFTNEYQVAKTNDNLLPIVVLISHFFVPNTANDVFLSQRYYPSPEVHSVEIASGRFSHGDTFTVHKFIKPMIYEEENITLKLGMYGTGYGINASVTLYHAELGQLVVGNAPYGYRINDHDLVYFQFTPSENEIDVSLECEGDCNDLHVIIANAEFPVPENTIPWETESAGSFHLGAVRPLTQYCIGIYSSQAMNFTIKISEPSDTTEDTTGTTGTEEGNGFWNTIGALALAALGGALIVIILVLVVYFIRKSTRRPDDYVRTNLL
eukprot:TRINITY_DN13064_c0_g1_i1.p1 TRINITY_DN13064_c0_g1~~TRINITY_DN13064_c0_g1_i1.p1  ORF type:complete len:502 (-),score=88.72 TRINITY_DN13064_c0_g1_i1:24-1529(-)